MTSRTCLRCDWHGDTEGAACPNCGTRPLYVMGAPPARGAEPDPEEAGPDLENASSVTQQEITRHATDPLPDRVDEVESSGRSARSLGAIALTVLLIVALGAWLRWHDDPAAQAAPSASPTPAASSSPAPDGVSTELLTVDTHAVVVGGIPLTYDVPSHGWGRFGSVSINKSSVGPQGAEAIIFWTIYPEGGDADACGDLLGSQVGPSIDDLAAAVSAAPGTELVTGPTDLTMDGRAAKHIVLTVRENVGCEPGFFFGWLDSFVGPFWTRSGVGTTIDMWIVDANGRRLVIEAETARRAGHDLEHEVQQIVRSIRFVNPSPG